MVYETNIGFIWKQCQNSGNDEPEKRIVMTKTCSISGKCGMIFGSDKGYGRRSVKTDRKPIFEIGEYMSEEKQENQRGEETVSIIQKRLEGLSGEHSEGADKANEGSSGHIYESDLTRKEKRLLEKEKIKGMGMGKRLQYIWMYYKAAIFGVIGAIILVFVIRDWYRNAQIVDILSIAIANGGLGDTEEWAEEIKADLGSTDEDDRVSFILNLNTDETGAEFDYNAQMAFIAQVQAQGIDVLVTTEDMCKNMSNQEFFADLTEALDEETLELLGDRAEQYYIKLEDSAIQEHIPLAYDEVCVAILGNTKNFDNAVKWVSSLVEEP